MIRSPELSAGAPRVLYSRNGAIFSSLPEGGSSVILTEAAQPGDDVKANNTLDPESANGVLGAVRLTLSSAKTSETSPSGLERDQKKVLPSSVSVKAHVTPDYVVYTVGVDFENPWEDRVCAALLQIPRIKGLLLLEERHKAGEVDYLPEVMEKETAKKKFEQAAASETHSASLSNADDEFFEVKIDKIAPGAQANFTTCLLQPKTTEVEMVVEDGDQDPMVMADILVTPAITGIEEGQGVPFTFEVTFSSEYRVAEVPYQVAKDSLDQIKVFSPAHAGFFHYARGTGDNNLPPRSLVVIQPDLENPNQKARLCAPDGVLTASVILVRLCRKKVNPMLEELTRKMGEVNVEDEGPVKPAKCVVRPNVFFDPKDGSPKNFSNVEITVPSELDDVGPCETPHRIFLIVDQSGSTSMRVDGDVTFLKKCIAFLQGMVRTLPRHIEALRRKNAINSQPITVHLWSFASNTRHLCTVNLPDASAEDMLASLEKDLLKKAGALQSTGCTNYDSFSAELQTVIESTEPHLNHVLLFTDGGATSLQRFEQNVQTMVSHPKAAFFQADCLGYGPWLNPATVTFFAKATSGEAIMVEKPEGEEMRIKLLGLIARSMLRAATTFELTIAGVNDAVELVAVQSMDTNNVPAVSTDVLEGTSPTWSMDVMPGQQLRLGIVHSEGNPLSMSICGVALPVNGVVPEESSEKETESEWEVVGPEDESGQTVPLTASESALFKIRKLTAAKALGHILLLEPAYSTDVFYPEETKAARDMALLRMSVDTQVPAPSVTRGCAVAKLKTTLTPIPEHCRPEEKSPWLHSFSLDHGGLRGTDPSDDVPQWRARGGGGAGPVFGSAAPTFKARRGGGRVMESRQGFGGIGSTFGSRGGGTGNVSNFLGSLGFSVSKGSARAADSSATFGGGGQPTGLAPQLFSASARSAPPMAAMQSLEFFGAPGGPPPQERRHSRSERSSATLDAEDESKRVAADESSSAKRPQKSKKMRSRSRRTAVPVPKPMGDSGPKTLARWLKHSRAGVYEPVTQGRSSTTLVGSWNFDERLREVLNDIRLLKASPVPSKSSKADPMDLVDSISKDSTHLSSMATKGPQVVLGSRTFFTEVGDAGQEQNVDVMITKLINLLRALLLSFVMCSVMKKGSIELEGVLKWEVHHLKLQPSALHDADAMEVLSTARALLVALDKQD